MSIEEVVIADLGAGQLSRPANSLSAETFTSNTLAMLPVDRSRGRSEVLMAFILPRDPSARGSNKAQFVSRVLGSPATILGDRDATP